MKIKVAMDIVSSKRGGPYVSTMNLVNSKLKENYDFYLFEYDRSIGRGAISWKRILDLRDKIKQINPEIVHFSGLQLSGFHIAIAAKLAHAKHTILVVHGSSTEALELSFLKKILLCFIELITLSLVEVFYGVSKYASQMQICKPFKCKNWGYIYNLPTSIFESTGSLTRSMFGFSDDDIVVISVARITREKGYHYLSEAIKLDCNPRVKYLIVGDGEYLESMKQNNAESIKTGKVVFTGKRSDIGDLLRISDIFVLPTLHETLSISLLEAASYSLPLVASNVGGVPEVIEDQKNGLLIKAADSQAIYSAIHQLVNNEELRKKMGNYAKVSVHKKFASDEILLKIQNLYKHFI